MQSLLDLWHRLTDVEGLIKWGGTVGLTAIIFAETGLLVGFFLPGDSLLVTAGLLAAGGHLNVYALGAVLSIAAIAGNSVGYAIGKATGPRLFTREDSLLFRRKHLEHAHAFYERHGGKTMILARFMPIVRTFVPVIAGAAAMDFRRFTVYNVIGGILWIWSMLLLGYFLGRYVPGIGEHVEVMIVVIVFVSVLPGIISWVRQARATRRVTKPKSGREAGASDAAG